MMVAAKEGWLEGWLDGWLEGWLDPVRVCNAGRA